MPDVVLPLFARWLMIAPAFAALTLHGAPQERRRADVPDAHKWNLADLYPSLDGWRSAKDLVSSEVPRLGTFTGQLGTSASMLADALDLMFAIDKELSRVYVYAGLLADEDTRDSASQGMRQQMVQLSATFSATSSFVEPEILRFPEGTIERFLAEEPRLRPYRFFLEDIVRRAPHTLTPAEEKILAGLGPLAQAPSAVFQILSNADFPYPEVRLSNGRTVTLTPANYAVYRAVGNRDDRRNAMMAFFDALGGFSRTFGTTMNGSIQRALIFARARQYESTLASTLDQPNIPISVYTRLVDGVNRNLASFHRYLRLRQRMLGVDELHYYDLYAPLVGSVDLAYTPEQAREHVLAALRPLGDDYVAVVGRAFRERWVDLFPTPGKRAGAYSQGGAYDVHPYILMNYNGRYDDMSTLAHELGHTMHSYYSNGQQPYVTARYPTFVAEVASTFNESLLIDYMRKVLTEPAARLALLGNYLEGIKGTVFRQTQFAEFERAMHAMAERGEAITGDALASLYLDITRRYYGHDRGIVIVDDYVAHEWSYVPHFYRDFYVFQYATSFTASEALAAKVKSGDQGAVERYLRFLASGGSKYPIELLADAGVDMTSDEPLDLTIREMNRVMDEMDALLDSGA